MTPKEQQRLSRVVWFETPALDLDHAVRDRVEAAGARSRCRT
ncbi:MAG: hypothetical protein ABSH47_16980 [Bryobacteraceae bacterium]|jgi:hypothetical protein